MMIFSWRSNDLSRTDENSREAHGFIRGDKSEDW